LEPPNHFALEAAMRIAERVVVCLAVLSALVAPAQSQEQMALPLSDVLKVGRETPDLLRQIDVELRRNYLRQGDVSCVALGGRGAPYQCQFGDRTLRIEADRTYFDIHGKRLGRQGEADQAKLPGRATTFRENNLRWAWTPERPR
jgi:hypothetical protein